MSWNYLSVDGNAPEPRESEFKTLSAPIFDEEGEEIGTGTIEVEFVEVCATAYIRSYEADKRIHSDDLHAALREEFTSYEI